MKKFWNKSSASADIFIYGDITSSKWDDTDTTAKSFVDDLNSFGGKPVTVHINSGGGDVFAGLAISNAIKNYSGGVTVSIDGIAASAASLIACGGAKVTMASNALYMLHLPATMLFGFYNAPTLDKVKNALAAIESSIVKTYEDRLTRADVPQDKRADVSAMIHSETWLTAAQAQSYGFIDEITDAVEMKIDDANKLLIVNSLNVDMKNFDEQKLRQALEVKPMNVQNEQSFFDKLTASIKEALTPVEKPATSAPAEAPPVVDAAQIRQQELSRIRDLQALKGDNSAINALIDVAIGKGNTVDEIKPYVDALGKIPTPKVDNAAEKIVAVIRDQMQSGAEGVTGGDGNVDLKKAQQEAVAKYANEYLRSEKS